MEVNSDLGSKKKFNVSGAQLAASLSFVILIVLKSYSVGFDRASQEIETFIPCESPNAKCTKVYSGTQILAEGLIIEVSDKAIAIYDGEKILVLENQNLRIETLPRI